MQEILNLWAPTQTLARQLTKIQINYIIKITYKLENKNKALIRGK